MVARPRRSELTTTTTTTSNLPAEKATGLRATAKAVYSVYRSKGGTPQTTLNKIKIILMQKKIIFDRISIKYYLQNAIFL